MVMSCRTSSKYGFFSGGMILSLLPVKKLSRQNTSCPSLSRAFAKMRADKSRTTGNQNAFSHNFEFFVYCKYRHKKWIFPYLGFISAVSVTDFVDGISPKREKMVIFPEIFLTDMEKKEKMVITDWALEDRPREKLYVERDPGFIVGRIGCNTSSAPGINGKRQWSCPNVF